MSEVWADRQRRTNQLVRIVAGHVLGHRSIPSATQLHGLCQLTWITSSPTKGVDNPKSTTVPGLEKATGMDFSGMEIADIARSVGRLTGSPQAEALIKTPIGFTNFYRAYRNSSLAWIGRHLETLTPIFRSALGLQSDTGGLRLVEAILQLRGIPKANHPDQRMHPQYLLTPVLFALDPRVRFPIINGASGVRDLLTKIGADGMGLPHQYNAMIQLYGHGGINDAADLDQAGQDIPDFLNTAQGEARKKLLGEQRTEGNDLPIKDDEDIEMVRTAGTVTCRRIHNQLTNKLRACRATFTLLEGTAREAMFDILAKNFDGDGTDLLIEVKSSADNGQIRMAIGQLYAYGYALYEEAHHKTAIMLPEEPNEETKSLLKWLGIGLLWFQGEHLRTATPWLRTFSDS